MGTWNIPYDSVPKAKRLKKRMAKPWIAKVKREDDYYFAKYPDADLIGDDWLSDMLGEKAEKSKKDFDIRPYVKKVLKRLMQELFSEEEVRSPEAVNIVRSTVGLRPLPAKKIVKKNVTTAKKKRLKIKRK